MPETEHPEIYQRVLRRGRQLRARRRLGRGAGAVAVTLAVFGLGLPLLRSPDPSDVVAGGPELVTTTTFAFPAIPSTQVPAGTQAGIGTTDTTTGPAGGEGSTGSAGSGPVSGVGYGEDVDPPVTCLNSYDPACGEFRWEPKPKPNDPMVLDVQVEQLVLRAGKPVTFSVHAIDPDARVDPDDCRRRIDFGDDSPTGTCVVDCVAFFGPWEPPEEKAADEVLTFQHVYAKAGTYTATFTIRSGEPCPANPYGSEATGEIEIRVFP